MTIKTSLSTRMRRLEQLLARGDNLSIGERLARAICLWGAMTPAEQAAEEARERDDCIASLSEPDAPEHSIEGRLQRMRRRLGRALVDVGNTAE